MIDRRTAIYILVDSKESVASGYVRGYQMYQSLKKIHDNVVLFESYNVLIQHLKKKGDEKPIIILRKPHENDLIKLKKIKKKKIKFFLVNDMIDQKSLTVCRLFNLLLTPNNEVSLKLQSMYPSIPRHVSYHNYDNRFKNRIHRENLMSPRFSMSGTINSFEKTIIKMIPEIKYIGMKPSINEIKKYNVALCFRDTTLSFRKPSTKVSAASVFNTVFAGTNSYAFEDLLGKDYPYFISMEEITVEKVQNLLAYIKNTYKTEVWKNAEKKMKIAYEKTNIDCITAKMYNEILEHYKEKYLPST